MSSYEEGDYDGARRFLKESLALYRQLGNRDRAATQLVRLGIMWCAAGDPAAASPFFEEALAIWQEAGYENGIAGALNGLGEVALAVGKTAKAAPLFAGALQRYRSEGYREGEAVVSRNLARLAWVTGDAATARTRLTEAMVSWWRAEAAHRVADTFEAFAVLAIGRDQPERAVQLAGAAAAIRDAAGRPLSERRCTALDQQLEPARLALGGAAAAALARGRAMSLDEAIETVVAAVPDALEHPPAGTWPAPMPSSGGEPTARPRSEPGVTPASASRPRGRPPRLAGGLTTREVEVLRLVAAGKTNRAIASDLVISEKTVGHHLGNVFSKLGVSSRAAATVFALRHELA